MLVASWILCAAVAGSTNPSIEVKGDTSCPAPAEVEAALPGLTGRSDPASGPDIAELTPDGDSVLVTLRRTSGEPLGEKRLDASQSCDERARAAAVVIAAWEAKLAPQAGTLAVETPAPAAVVQAAPGPVMHYPARPEPETRIEPGVGGGVSVNGTTLASVARIDVAIIRTQALLMAAVGGLFVGSHAVDVGPGDATWRRFGLVGSVGSRRYWSPIFLEARAGVALTWLDISGSSYPSNTSGITFDPGIPITVRFGVRTGHVRWWADATAAFWPRGQEVYVNGGPGSSFLPRAEALLGLGASYVGGLYDDD
jgi:hypothetical protein